MILQLTKEELEGYHGKVAEWYNNRTRFVVERLLDSGGFREGYRMGSAGAREQYQELCTKFEETNPQPTWKDLL